MCCTRAADGRLFHASLAAPVLSICIFQKWQETGFFLRLWQAGLAEYDEMEGIAWNWQSIDRAMHKAPLGTECVAPTLRIGEKNGRKRNLLVDGVGVPFSLVVIGANTHDVKLLEATLDQLVIEMPDRAGQYNLCADAGYIGAPESNAAVERNYNPHVKQRREEAHDKLIKPGFKARRWVVERTHSWMNRFRKLLASFEKTEATYVALLSLACAIICWRQTLTIYG